jgi:nitrate/nitrite transport system substrate-binding protein
MSSLSDKLLNGQIDAAQVLYGLVYAVQMGIAGPKRDMAVLMTLNQNGQGITLARRLQHLGITTGETLASSCIKAVHTYTLAHTFPTGTHAMWLYYWLASYGSLRASCARS